MIPKISENLRESQWLPPHILNNQNTTSNGHSRTTSRVLVTPGPPIGYWPLQDPSTYYKYVLYPGRSRAPAGYQPLQGSNGVRALSTSQLCNLLGCTAVRGTSCQRFRHGCLRQGGPATAPPTSGRLSQPPAHSGAPLTRQLSNSSPHAPLRT